MTSGGSAVDGVSSGGIDPERALQLLTALLEGTPDLRAAALIDADGSQIAASDGSDWAAGGAALWRAADRTGPEPASAVHIGTGDGEVFAVRGQSSSVVATSERFALASLVLSDLRALLRELEGRQAAG